MHTLKFASIKRCQREEESVIAKAHSLTQSFVSSCEVKSVLGKAAEFLHWKPHFALFHGSSFVIATVGHHGLQLPTGTGQGQRPEQQERGEIRTISGMRSGMALARTYFYLMHFRPHDCCRGTSSRSLPREWACGRVSGRPRGVLWEEGVE